MTEPTPVEALVPAGVTLAEIENTTNVGSLVTGVLLVQSTETVAVAATTAASTTVAARATASAAGGAAGAGGPASAGKALGNAQRLQCYSKLAGPNPDGDDGGGGGWTNGRLGLTGSLEARRRRLQSSNRAGGGSSNRQEDPVANMLSNAMLDTLLTVLLYIAITIGLHYCVLLYYFFFANRKCALA